MDHRQRARLDASPVAFGPNAFQSQIENGSGYSSTPPFSDSNSTSATMETRAFRAEIVRLKHLLNSVHSQADRQAEAYRKAMHQTAERASAQHRTEAAQHQAKSKRTIESLQQQLRLEREQFKQRETELMDQLNIAGEERDKAQQTSKSHADRVQVMKGELSNLAAAAAAEQQQLTSQLAAQTARFDAMVKAEQHQTESLKQTLNQRNRQVGCWEQVHQLATSICDGYETELRRSRTELRKVKHTYHQLHDEVENACCSYEEAIDHLRDNLQILQTDHETVELINASLEHSLAKLEFEYQQLQDELDQVAVGAARDHQESVRALKVLDEQFQTTKSRLTAVAEEKCSLIESLGNLKSAADDFDATLFAKDQEIAATRRLAEKTQQELDQVHRDRAITASQKDDFENRIRKLSTIISELESEKSAMASRAEQAENRVADRDRQIREIQSASRAAEATALISASEMEQQLSIEIQRLESEIDHLKNHDHQPPVDQEKTDQCNRPSESPEQSQLEERITELESQQITLRERHQQSQVANERLIESLNKEVSSLLAEQEASVRKIAEFEITNKFLQRDLDEYSRYENPLNEVKRLSRALSKKTAETARQRDALTSRIEQLLESRLQTRAA